MIDSDADGVVDILDKCKDTTVGYLTDNKGCTHLNCCISCVNKNDVVFSGNVGIGTDSPGYTLDVSGDINFTGALYQNGNLFSGFSCDGHSLDAADGDPIDVVYVENSGNVGIGTSSPKEKLDLAGKLRINGNSYSVISNNSDPGREILQLRAKSDATDSGSAHDGSGLNLYGNDDSSFPGGIKLFTNGGTSMAITKGGNVGIGTRNPDLRLHVETDDATQLRVKDTSSAYKTDVVQGNTVGQLKTSQYLILTSGVDNTADYIDFQTDGGISRMFIDSSGNVGIGTTTPKGKLHIYGDTDTHIKVSAKGNPRLVLNSLSASDGAILFHEEGVRKSYILHDVSEDDLIFSTSGSNKDLVIDRSGNVGIGTASPQGALDVSGKIYQRGNPLHADYVFEPDFSIEPIEDHAEFMWKEKHLKAVPKAVKDEKGRDIVEYGSHLKGMLEELEKAHVYIAELNETIKAQKKALNTLKREYGESISTLLKKVELLEKQNRDR